MVKKSAGILLFRISVHQPEVFLVHPGGPFFVKKDLGAWSIPKGEYPEDEDPLTAAVREFLEETGTALQGDFIPLQPIVQKGGKAVMAWALQGDLDVNNIISNMFSMEWPPGKGIIRQFPEIDRGEWFDAKAAKEKINPAQAAFIEELEQILAQ